MDQLVVSDNAEIFALMNGKVYPMGDLEEWMVAMAAHRNSSYIYFYAARKVS